MYRILPVLLLLLSSIAQGGETLYQELELTDGGTVYFAVHLPDDYDAANTYPVLIGPGDGMEGKEPGFYWQSDPYSHGWIIVDAQLWERDTQQSFAEVLDWIQENLPVEGGKFHAVCWSANSAGIFDLVIDHAARFYSITGMAGNPRNLSSADVKALAGLKVQFVVGENDRGWQASARQAHKTLQAGGVDSQLEIVPNAPHVMKELVGEPFMQRLEKLRPE
jgi:pimeloyl-ACP methyl ester carboxylesterase